MYQLKVSILTVLISGMIVACMNPSLEIESSQSPAPSTAVALRSQSVKHYETIQQQCELIGYCYMIWQCDKNSLDEGQSVSCHLTGNLADGTPGDIRLSSASEVLQSTDLNIPAGSAMQLVPNSTGGHDLSATFFFQGGVSPTFQFNFNIDGVTEGQAGSGYSEFFELYGHAGVGLSQADPEHLTRFSVKDVSSTSLPSAAVISGSDVRVSAPRPGTSPLNPNGDVQFQVTVDGQDRTITLPQTEAGYNDIVLHSNADDIRLVDRATGQTATFANSNWRDRYMLEAGFKPNTRYDGSFDSEDKQFYFKDGRTSVTQSKYSASVEVDGEILYDDRDVIGVTIDVKGKKIEFEKRDGERRRYQYGERLDETEESLSATARIRYDESQGRYVLFNGDAETESGSFDLSRSEEGMIFMNDSRGESIASFYYDSSYGKSLSFDLSESEGDSTPLESLDSADGTIVDFSSDTATLAKAFQMYRGYGFISMYSYDANTGSYEYTWKGEDEELWHFYNGSTGEETVAEQVKLTYIENRYVLTPDAANDTIYGGSGEDTLTSDGGLEGGSGGDTLNNDGDFTGGSSSDTIDFSNSNDGMIYGGSGEDTIYFE